MSRYVCSAAGCAAVVALSAAASASASSVVTITTSQDNTLIQTSDGSLSLGDSLHIFVGRVGPIAGGTLRRGVIAFDIAAAVPEGATITNVTLELHMSMSSSKDHPVVLKRLLAEWGEGTSEGFGGLGVPATPGDATWLHRFWPDVFWTTPGGDFTSTVSATTLVGFYPGWYTWDSTPQLIADVQSWLDDPSTNFGWLVQGEEGILQTAKRFGGKKSPPQERPRLHITYTVANPFDITGDGIVDIFDLLEVLANWGECEDVNDCPADLDGDGVVDIFDLLLLLANWG